jgi:hypothetical protein
LGIDSAGIYFFNSNQTGMESQIETKVKTKARISKPEKDEKGLVFLEHIAIIGQQLNGGNPYRTLAAGNLFFR